MESEDIVTKLVLFTIAKGANTFSEQIVNIVQLYELPLRFAKTNIFDGKLKLEISDTYWQFKLAMRNLVVDKRTNQYGYRWASRRIVYTILQPDAHSITQ